MIWVVSPTSPPDPEPEESDLVAVAVGVAVAERRGTGARGALRPGDRVGVQGDRAVAGEHPALDGRAGGDGDGGQCQDRAAEAEPVPSVAELPTCQKTLQAWAPLTSMTTLLGGRGEREPAWKMKTASGSPCASSVSVPVSPIDGGGVVDARRQGLPAEVGGDRRGRALRRRRCCRR